MKLCSTTSEGIITVTEKKRREDEKRRREEKRRVKRKRVSRHVSLQLSSACFAITAWLLPEVCFGYNTYFFSSLIHSILSFIIDLLMQMQRQQQHQLMSQRMSRGRLKGSRSEIDIFLKKILEAEKKRQRRRKTREITPVPSYFVSLHEWKSHCILSLNSVSLSLFISLNDTRLPWKFQSSNLFPCLPSTLSLDQLQGNTAIDFCTRDHFDVSLFGEKRCVFPMIASWGENGNFPSISFILLQRHHQCLPFDQCLIYSVPCLVFSGYISFLEILCQAWKSDDKEPGKIWSMLLIKEVTMTGQPKERKDDKRRRLEKKPRKEDSRKTRREASSDTRMSFDFMSIHLMFRLSFHSFLSLLHLFPFFMSDILTSFFHQHHHRNDYVIAFMW